MTFGDQWWSGRLGRGKRDAMPKNRKDNIRNMTSSTEVISDARCAGKITDQGVDSDALAY